MFINTIKLLTKLQGKVLIFIILIQIISGFYTAKALDHIEIINIKPAKFSGGEVDKENGLMYACRNWHLSKQQITQIFHYSERYITSPLVGFSILPCKITGKLKLKNKILFFSVNAGSTSAISTNDNTIYYGCRKKECEQLFLEPYSNEK